MYENKTDGYFKNIRKELLDLIPQKNKYGSMLEIGAGSGATLIYAKKKSYAQSIFGVELCTVANSFQQSKEFENFIIGNIENIELPFNQEQFDVILCADVLEHLVNPYDVIKKMHPYLKNNGVFITSLPNIRQMQMLKQIYINGDFKYTDAGILDKTHLRFFCKKNMIELFENNGYVIDRIVSNSNLIGKTTKMLNRVTFNVFDQFLAAQYYLVASKKC